MTSRSSGPSRASAAEPSTLRRGDRGDLGRGRLFAPLGGGAASELLAAPGRAAVVARLVGHDRHEPRRERCSGTQAVERSVGLDERVLYRLLRVGHARGDASRDPHRRSLVHDDHSEGIDVSRARSREKIVLGRGWIDHVTPSTPRSGARFPGARSSAGGAENRSRLRGVRRS